MGRIRKIKNANELILNFKQLIKQKQINYFNNSNQLELEIGSGKGNFIINKAINNPNINFIAVEREPTIVYKLLKKINGLDKVLNNVLVLAIDVKDIGQWLARNTIDNIYLNFPDPWPKKRHEKYRLTSPTFLNIYHLLLKDGSHLYFKTDQEGLYNFTIGIIKTSKIFAINDCCDNLYNNEHLLANNVPTEYETKFVLNNKIIYFVDLIKKS